MKRPESVRGLEALGRVRLSKSFFMRDMLYSEVANVFGLQNIPDDPDLAIAAATQLCENLLEPLQDRFGRISIRSAYRAPEVNRVCNEKQLGCAMNEKNYAGHIFDRRDANGHMGAMATIVVNSFIDYYEATANWQAIAWWVHDNLPPCDTFFFPKYAAFNISWHEHPRRTIQSYIPPKGYLTKPGMANFDGSHETEYVDFLTSITT